MQLVRASLLENLRGEVSNDVARDNHTTVTPVAPMRSRLCSTTSVAIATRATRAGSDATDPG
jgi:hypothetical protein